MSRALRTIALGMAATVALLVAPAPVSAQAPPRRALVYGDSLTWEAQAGLRSAIEAQLPGYEAITRTSPGTALCDALPAMRRDANLNAGVVVIEFVAVPFSACMRGRDPAQAERADLETAIALWQSRGVPVVLVGAPNAPGQPGEPSDIAIINRDVATQFGETYVDSGVLLRDPWTAVYQQRLPCLTGEGAEQGCTDGTIEVRTPGGGGHFCAVPDVGPCPVYSSGVIRFSAAIAAAAARAAGTQPGPLPVVPPTLGALAAARSLFTGAGAIPSQDAVEQVDDVAVAQGVVLTVSDVPADFTEIPPAEERVDLDDRACEDIRTAAEAMSEAAQAKSAFTAAGDVATIDSVVSVFASKRRAKATYRSYAAPKTTECLQLRFTEAVTAPLAGTGAQVAVTVVSVPLTTGEESIGYAVSNTVTSAEASITRHQLIEVQRVGRGIAASVLTNVHTPPPDAMTQVMNDTMATRLAAAVG